MPKLSDRSSNWQKRWYVLWALIVVLTNVIVRLFWR
jgi:hypothetical protein